MAGGVGLFVADATVTDLLIFFLEVEDSQESSLRDVANI